MRNDAIAIDQHHPGKDRSDAWTAERAWVALISPVDAVLRAYLGIYEFTDHPDCILRVALAIASEPITLADATAVEIGDPIGALHFWNEHLPRYSGDGPDLCWAVEMRRRLDLSLRALARHIEADARWDAVQALMGATAFSSRLGFAQLCRVVERYGFQCFEGSPYAIGAWAGSFGGYALARAYNPDAAVRQPFLRRTHQLWISRAALLRRYQPNKRGRSGPRRLRSGSSARSARRSNGATRS